jgi:hypothetical protein
LDLVVGLDAITDTNALAALRRATLRFPLLTVLLFLNSNKGRSFHPKASWFRYPNGGRAITGSGNLTKGGLVRNWEAFAQEEYDQHGIDDLEAQWTTWKAAHAAELRALNDQEAAERAALNRSIARAVRRVTRLSEQEAQQALGAIPVVPANDGDPFLATELGSNRLTQVGIRKTDFVDFFGVPAGGSKNITVYRVYSDGRFSDPDRVPTISTGPRNYRFRTRAMAGVSYPQGGRPIALFERVDADTFKYMMVLPTQPEHVALSANMGPMPPPGHKGRRLRLSSSELEQIWPACPLLP